MTIENFIEELASHPEYCIHSYNINTTEITLFVTEYNDAQLEIPKFAYGRNIVIKILV